LIRILDGRLIVQTQNPGQLKAVFGDTVRAALINGWYYCAVPYTLEASRVLNNLGFKAPSPIRDDYDFPIQPPFKPRWYQIDTAEAMTLNNRFHCLSAPRTGKTLSALWASDWLRKKGKIRKTLIVAPLSTLEDVWAQTIFTNFPMRTYAILHGSRAKRKKLLNLPHDYYIINHHGVGLILEELADRQDIDLVIVDESGELRNARAKTLWVPLNHIINRQGLVRSAWGLTGTPTPSAPTDAYAVSKLITPERYKGHFTTFKSETMYPYGPFKWLPRKGWENTVSRVLHPSIRFERSVCTDMEPCDIWRKAELSDEQAKHYKQLLNLTVTEIRGSVVTAVNAGVLVSKLIQTACGVVYGADGSAIRLDFGPRLGVLEELIEQNDEKVVVFVPFTGVLDALAEKLRKKWTVAIVDGGVSKGKRDQIFQDFRRLDNPHIILAHPGAMSHGLDLTAASLIIWYAPHNKSTYIQACARIDGSRQTVKQDIAHIYATAEEKRAYRVIKEQGRMQDVLLDLVQKGG
jgi:superfamily II DNA or RNA helicase